MASMFSLKAKNQKLEDRDWKPEGRGQKLIAKARDPKARIGRHNVYNYKHKISLYSQTSFLHSYKNLTLKSKFIKPP